MAILTTAAFDKALKILYPKGLEEQWYPEAPFCAWIPKTYNFEGSSKQVNPLFAGIRGSDDFATALANKSTPEIEKFTVTRTRSYVIGSIENEAVKASRSERGAVARALKTSMDSAMYEFARNCAFQIWNDGSGTRGTVASYAAGVVTLDDANDVVRFEVGMRLKRKNSGGTLQAGTYLITAIDRSAGTLTVTLEGGAAAMAANDTLARDGDYTASGSTNLAGVLGWVPPAGPTATPFFGVDRTQDPTRLAGITVSGGGATIEETVFDAQAEAAINGARVDTLWMHPKRFAELCKSIHGKAWYPQGEGLVKSSKGKSGKIDVGFPGFVFPSAQGPVTVATDANMPYAYGLMTRKAAWELACLDGCPHYADEDGRKFLRETAADAIEYRLKVYWQLICHRPLDNVIIDWDN